MIEFLDRVPQVPDGSTWDGSFTREPEPVDPATEARLRAHARAAMARVCPPESVGDYDLGVPC